VGAHTTHVSGSAIAPPFDCSTCHVKPADALSPGHVDGATATVTFGGLATNGALVPPSWDRGSATCASTYCHGATLGGGTNKAPVWTSVGTGEASCGSCHGLPPPAPHPAVTGLTSCNGCHPDTVDASGRVIAPASGGKHLNGVLEISGGHPASWMDPSSLGFHAYSADAGLAACQACHGPQLDRFANGNCASCHGTSWATSCTMCHGDPARAANKAAPPRTIYGMDADPIRVGAHAAHLAGGPMAGPFTCDVCHVVPADAFSAGHIDQGTATLTFGGLAVAPDAAAPTWSRSTATCASTYCHGATLGGGSNKTPVWTGGSAQAACGSCHGTPPPAPHPAVSTALSGCAVCHNATVAADGSLIPPASGGKHLNGTVDAGSLEAGCTSCHGIPPNDGGTNGHLFHSNNVRVDCARCHVGYTRTSADPAYHMNGVRDVRFSYPTPNPDPGLGSGIPPTLEACNASPGGAIAVIPQSSTPPVWSFNQCGACHAARDYRFNACCNDPGAPVPDWCSTYW
jgi:predicted CxxxxCH...CXXCH cytochrome family protein